MTSDSPSAHEALSRYGRDLVALARSGDLPPVFGRDRDAQGLLRLMDEGRPILLVGEEGVGRTSVLHAAAHLLAGTDGAALFEIHPARVLAGAAPATWQARIDAILHAAKAGGYPLVLTDIHHLPHVGATADSPRSLLDHLRPFLQDPQVCVVGEVSPAQVVRMAATPDFVGPFRPHVVEALPREVQLQVVQATSDHLGLPLDSDALRLLFDLTSRYLPARPQPGPALELLRRVHHYQEQKAGIGEHEPVNAAFVERVFSIYAGLPTFVISRTTTRRAADIRAWFGERVVGQREAVEAVVEAIAQFQAGLHDPSKPLGTFLFSGPTGVGKTELARTLATFLFGGPGRLQRYDMAAFQDDEALHRLLGDPEAPDAPAALVDAVRRQPFQVVLFDGIERAHPTVFDAVVTLLDDGHLTTPRGDHLDVRACFIICTTQAGARTKGAALGFADPAGSSRHRRLLDDLQATFSPDVLQLMQHIVGFHPLSPEHVRAIARAALRDIFQREGITARNLLVDVDDEALDLVIGHGFDPRRGARELKRELHRRIVLPLAMTIMEHQVPAGELLRVTDVDGHVRIRRLDTDASREVQAEAVPIPMHAHTGHRADVAQGVRTLQEDLEALSLASGEATLRVEHHTLSTRREHDGFWDNAEQASRDLRAIDDLSRVLDRVDSLRTRIQELSADLEHAEGRAQLLSLARRVDTLREAMAQAFREVLYMGRDAVWDALVEVRPLGGHRRGRDVIVRMYLGWAASRGLDITWVHDPRTDDEAALFAVRGPYAHGYLHLEAGVHRVRDGEDTCTTRVRVAPWTDRIQPMAFVDHRALKAVGTFGGKVRSRLACQGGLVLQNDRTLSDNRELAVQIGASWSEAPAGNDLVVRRYDLQAPLVRDELTGETSTRADAIGPEPFHALLCRRLDVAGQGPDAA